MVEEDEGTFSEISDKGGAEGAAADGGVGLAPLERARDSKPSEPTLPEKWEGGM